MNPTITKQLIHKMSQINYTELQQMEIREDHNTVFNGNVRNTI